MNCWCNKYMFFSVLSFSIFFINLSVLDANSYSVSLQQEVQPLCHEHEKLALLQFKHSFLITCLASHPAFARPKVQSWWDAFDDTNHTIDCCMWDGVYCNEKTGHVIGLDLSSSCLFGTFPYNTAIFGLKHLRELDLSDNHFNYSQIPPAIVRLSKLTKLNLSQSSFMGLIPNEMSKLSSLTILDLSFNYELYLDYLQYEMTFAKFIGNLTHLTHLHLVNVYISSVVPDVLSNFTSLRSLILTNCQLFGAFPSRIFQLPKIEEITLSRNYNLTGHLPEFPTNSPLRIIKLGLTSFSGELTSSIGNLVNLTTLVLTYTDFTGLIPSSLGNLTNLSILDLYSNFNGGDLPLPITNLTQLTKLSIYNAYLTPQALNSWLLKLRKIECLSIPKVTSGGEIPPALANLTRLNWLTLNGNKLTGRLPIWLANKTKLTFLDLTNNQFQGNLIPQWFSQLRQLNTLKLSSSGSVAMFEPLLKLPRLDTLELGGINFTFPQDVGGSNTSLAKFVILALQSCNLTEFPRFLRYQNELEVLDLSSNSIMGTIPQWFVNTTAKSLLEMSLSDNHLTGFEQPQIFLPWYNIELLYIGNNNFQGELPIPPTSLLDYQVYGNKLYGVIPKDICKASSMTFLDLSMNNFSGQIPHCIVSQLISASLVVLNLHGNRFEGPIPQTFTSACKVRMINLSNNQLNGQLPKSLTNCGSLEVLDVGKNQLSDTFPSWLGSLPNLQVLVLRHNNFHGRIVAPEFGHQFSSLRVIDLSNNFHVGNLPSRYLQNWVAMRTTDEVHIEYSTSSNISLSVSDSGVILDQKLHYTYVMTITNKGSERFFSAILTVFRAIDLSSNNFTGEIPDIIGSLIGLQALNLSNNHLSGVIPSSLANMIDLEALDLSQNMLSGEIPQQFSKVTTLEVFNVSHNRLVGRVPQGEQFNAFDNSSFDGNLALCGAPLSNQCRNADFVSPVEITSDETEQDSELIDWIIRSLGCLGGCIVGFVIGKTFITDPYHDWFMETFGRRKTLKPRASRLPSRLRRNG